MLRFRRTEQPHTANSTSAMAIERSRNMAIERSRNMEPRDHSNGAKQTVRLSMLVVLLGIGTCLSAQDMIVFSNGSIEQVKILKVGDNEIEYKKWTNQDGPTFSTSKTKIFSIKYQDGTEEKIETQVATYSGDQRQVQAQKQAQGSYPQSPDGGFSMHLGCAFPLGEFKDDHRASTGINVGIKGKIPLQVDGLGIFISGDFIFNWFSGEIFYGDEGVKVDVKKTPGFINVPLFVGLNYKYSVSQMFAVWCEGGLGANFRKITNEEASYTFTDHYHYGNYTMTTKAEYDLGTSFAGQIGGGIMINDIFSIGLHYYGMGESKIKAKFTSYSSTWGTHTESGEFKITQNCFMVRLGFHF